ncbi:MAG: hypothetical protein HC774_00275 [Sphingomonadales bacterium]|nr:hypothetical protein [Sphingomonadales bacterium]
MLVLVLFKRSPVLVKFILGSAVWVGVHLATALALEVTSLIFGVRYYLHAMIMYM